ncbi:MAG: tetratricopeptide repeat protein [Verrucomicrobiota bacterium]
MEQKDFRRTIVVCLLLGLGTIALYAPALTFSFVNYDDQLYVLNNPNVNHGLTAAGLGWAFQAGYAANWHPLTWLSHMVDCQVFGLRPGGPHAINVLLHALNCVLLFQVLRRLTGAFWRSAMVAALFAWHPLHVESVAWIAERKDVLSTFFLFLTLWAWVRYVEDFKIKGSKFKVFYVAALVLFALGLLSKPMVVTLPCMLLLLDWWPLGRLQLGPAPAGAEAPPPVARQMARLVVEKIPFFVLSLGSSIITVIAERREGSASIVARLPFKVRFVTAVLSYFRYLAKTFWPTDLGATYPFVFRHSRWELVAVALLLAGITVMAFGARKSRPYWLFGWLWFLGTLFPTLNLVAAGGQPMADRYMYIPSIGLFVLICWEVYDLAAASQYAQVILGGLCGAALAGCCVLSSFQLQYWRNEESLVSRVPMSDYNFIGHANYAAFLMHHNQLAKAEAECNKAISISPTYGLLSALMGDILLMEGKFDQSIERLNFALKADPTLVDARLPLGRALLAKRRPLEAAADFKAVLQAEPRNFEAETWLGRALLIQGKTADGIAEFRRSLTLQPNQPEVLNDLAWILATSPHLEIRNGAEAVKLASRACQLMGNKQPILIGTLAAAYAEAGRWDEAVAAAQQAHDLAAADGLKALADRNLQLQRLYRAHVAYRETQ